MTTKLFLLPIMNFRFFLIICFAFLATSIYGKIPSEVTKEALNEKKYALDPAAVASILNEQSFIRYQYSDNNFYRVQHVKKIIKIYKKEGLHYGVEFIYLNDSNNGSEKINNIKVVSYSYEGDKITSIKMKKEGVYKDRINDSKILVKLTASNVKEGNIIEFSYDIKSPFTGYIPAIYLQKDIPIVKMKTEVTIPQYFSFNIQTRGEDKVNLITKTGVGSYTYIDKKSKKEYPYNYTTNTYTVNIAHQKAIKRERFVDNVWNYIPSVEFFLNSIQYEGGQKYTYAYSWDDVLKKITKEIEQETIKTKYFQKDVNEVLENKVNLYDKMLAIFELSKWKMRWNKYFAYRTYNGLKDAYSKGSGTSGEVNGVLLSMLKYAGIKARPVFVTSIVIKKGIFPNYQAFNHMLVEVLIPGKDKIYLDAISGNVRPNFFREPVLLGQGKVLTDSGKAIDVDLSPKNISTKNTVLHYNVSASGAVKGKLRTQFSNYEAQLLRDKFRGYEKKLKTRIEDSYHFDNLENFKVQDLEEPYKKVSLSYSFELKETSYVNKIDDEIYISPLLFLDQIDFPTEEERNYPLFFLYPFSKRNIISISIPEGYKLQESPKSLSLALENKEINYTYKTNIQDNKINIVVLYELNNTFFLKEKYSSLKNVISKIGLKESEQIILKKM